jgi:peroxiredoxin
VVGLRELARAYPDVRIYAISPDSPEQSRTFAGMAAADHRGDVTFSLLSDPLSRVIDRYGLRDEAYLGEKEYGIPHPAVFVLDQKGRVRWVKISSDFRERPSNEEVAAALDAFE